MSSLLHFHHTDVMFDDIDELCNSHQEEQKAYLLGISDAKEDPDVKKQLSDLGRENFTRGHNAGFACGLVIAALELYKEKDTGGDLSRCESILAECNAIVRKMKDLSERKVSQPETTYQKVDDDDDEHEIGNKNLQDQKVKTRKSRETEENEEEEEEDLRNSFRVILVTVIERFISFWKKNVTTSEGLLQFPSEQWEFLTSLVQDNKAGSPDTQTAISNLIQDATASPSSRRSTKAQTHNDESDNDGEKDLVDTRLDEEKSNVITKTAPKRSGRPIAKPTMAVKKKTLDEVLDW